MSENTQRWPHAKVMNVANALVDLLRDSCEQIEIAGSLRRQRQNVGDIEILFIPKTGRRKVGLFSDESYSEADAAIEQLVRDGVLTQRPKIDGSFTWGEKNKLAIHIASGIPVDLFATTPENWWVSLVVRTGSKEMNLKLTTNAQRLNRSLMAYGCGVRGANGTVVAATSERHVFELCGVPYREPHQR